MNFESINSCTRKLLVYGIKRGTRRGQNGVRNVYKWLLLVSFSEFVETQVTLHTFYSEHKGTGVDDRVTDNSHHHESSFYPLIIELTVLQFMEKHNLSGTE